MSIVKFSDLGLNGAKGKVFDTPAYVPPTTVSWYQLTPSQMDTFMAIVSSEAGTVAQDSVSVGTSFGSLAHRSAVLHPNGNIYCVPRNTGNGMLEIDPINNTSTYKTFGALGTLTSTSAAYFHSAVLAETGNIIAIPFNYDKFIEIDVENETTTEFTGGVGLSGTVKFSGGVLGSDGNIYCVPQNFGSVAVVDPSTLSVTTTNYGLSIPTSLAYWGGARSWKANNKIFMSPLQANDFLVIDTDAQTATRENFGLTFISGQNNHYGCSVNKDGSIVAIKGAITTTITDKVIDPANMTGFEFSRGTSDIYFSHGMARDGEVYAIGNSGDGIVKYDSVSNGMVSTGLTSTIDCIGTVTDFEGNIVSIPDSASSTLRKLDVPGNMNTNTLVDSDKYITTTFVNQGKI